MRKMDKSLVALLASASVLAASGAAMAQEVTYGGSYGAPSAPAGGYPVTGGYTDSAPMSGYDAPAEAAPEERKSRRSRDRGSSGRQGPRVDVAPYLEVQQVVYADLKGDGDVVTYSTVAAGVDASVSNRRAEGQVSLRYERRIEWDDQVGDADSISGLARGSVQLVPNAVSLDAGAIATRSRVDTRGPAPTNLTANADNVTQVYSAYVGPTVATQVGSLDVNAAYRLGYTRVETPDAVLLPPGAQPIDAFDDSVSHSASASIGQQPGESLPIGWAVGGAYVREDAGQLDQRFENANARLDITVPVSPTVALLGGVGYEKTEVTERDAVRDVNGVPVVGPDGRLITDNTSPRLLAYEEDGLIWDVGVMWKPSRRTQLTAQVGERYGSMTYQGSFSYTPSERLAMGVSVYDTVTGFGSNVNDTLAGIGTQFQAFRNPIGGDLNSCVFGTPGSTGGGCFNNALQSVASSAFRTRGVTGQVAATVGGWNTGVALGYNRRSYLNSQLGALSGFNGALEESYFANWFLAKELDQQSSFLTNVYANYLESGGNLGSYDVMAVGANASYYRSILRGLSATAAVGIDSYKPDGFESELTGSAQVGLRYTF